MTPRSTAWHSRQLAVLMAATLAACGSDTANPAPSPAQPAQAAPAATTPPTPTTAQPASRPPARPATTNPDRDFGFIRSWTAKTGTIYLRFDRAILLTGTAADNASAAHGGESPVPNDLYIQNDNPRLRELVIVDQAKVIGSQHLTGSPGPNPSSLKALLSFVHNGGPQAAATPFHLTYNDNGLVTRVQEQYLP